MPWNYFVFSKCLLNLYSIGNSGGLGLEGQIDNFSEKEKSPEWIIRKDAHLCGL